MDIEYKSESRENPIYLYTHFLYRGRTKNHKTNIEYFNQNIINEQMVQNCIDEMCSDNNNIHSVKVLCEFIQENPIKTFAKFQIHDIIVFFDCIKIPEIQKEVLQSICFFIQLIPFNNQYQELIQRIDFYQNIQRLITPPIEKESHEIALWCAVYSLKLNEDFRVCLFKAEIFDTLMKYNDSDINMSTNYSEYIRGKFFKTATFYCDEMGDMILTDIIRFLIRTIQKVSSTNQPKRLFLCCGIDALRNTFKSTDFSFDLIKSNNMLPIFVSLLFDREDEKIRISSAKIIYELIQSMVFSSIDIINADLMKKLFEASQLNDIPLFHICMIIMKEILSNDESFIIDEIMKSLYDFDLSKCFANCCSFEIKIEMLSILQLLIFYTEREQIPNLLSQQNVEFICDLINSGTCGVSADVVHVFTIAMSILDDPEYSEMIKNVIIDSGAYDQLRMQMDDPENDKDDIGHIEAFVRSLDIPEE